MKNHSRYRLLAMTGILTLAFTITSGCSQTKEATKKVLEVPVATETISKGSLSNQDMITGTIQSGQNVDVMPKASGEVVSIAVKKGDKVKKGQVLAKLDGTDYEFGLKQAKVNLKRANETYDQAKAGVTQAQNELKSAQASLKSAELSLSQAKDSRQDSIELAKSNVAAAKQQWDDAKTNLERNKSLFNEGLIPKQQLEQSQTTELQAKAAYDQAVISQEQANRQGNIQVSEVTVEQAEIGIARAKKQISDAQTNVNLAKIGVEDAQIAVDKAQSNFDDLTITSPVAGEVVEVKYDIGEVASVQAPFVQIVSTDNYYAEVYLTAEQLFNLEIGDTLDVNIPSLEKTLKGKLSYISPTSDQSGLFKIEVDVKSDRKSKIRQGIIAQVGLKQVLVKDSVLIPTEALIEHDDDAKVFIVKDGKAIEKQIEVIQAETDLTAVKGEITPGDIVVIKGQNLLKTGDQVKVIKEDK